MALHEQPQDALNAMQKILEQRLHRAQSDLQQWENHEQQFLNTREKVHNLPDSITHEVLVPFGKLAFMKGRLEHTNELNVLLGSNTFVKMSAKEASEFLGRRLEYTESKRSDIERTVYDLEARLDVTAAEFDLNKGVDEEGNPIVEINEEYFSDEEVETTPPALGDDSNNKYGTEDIIGKDNALIDIEDDEHLSTDPDVEEAAMEMEELWLEMERLEELELLNNELAASDDDSEMHMEDDDAAVISSTRNLERLLEHSMNKSNLDQKERKHNEVKPMEEISKDMTKASSRRVNFAIPDVQKSSAPISNRAAGQTTVEGLVGTKMPFSGDIVERAPVSTKTTLDSSIGQENPIKMSKFKARRMGLVDDL
eukprot:CFRG1258T1